MNNLNTSFESFVNENLSLNEKKFYAYYIEDNGERPYDLTHDAIWKSFNTEEERDEFVKKMKKDKKYKYVQKSSKKQKESAYYDREPHYQSVKDEMKEREKDEKNSFIARKAMAKAEAKRNKKTNENILPKPYKKVKCLECGTEVCDNVNYKIGHLYNKHNCKPSVGDYKAKRMLKQYFPDVVKESLGNSPFKVGMKVDMVVHDGRAGKLIFYCENDSIIIEVAPAGGADIYFEGDIDEIIDAQIIDIKEDEYEIELSFDNCNDLHMEDDTGGEGLEAWIR
jgi:hypothetical protein